MLTPTRVVEITPAEAAHIKQHQLAGASVLAIGDRAEADARPPKPRYRRLQPDRSRSTYSTTNRARARLSPFWP